MHELALSQEIVAACAERASGRTVTRVVLEVGTLSCVAVEALTFCFDLCAQDTVVEGARLQVISIPGRGRCHTCDTDVDLEQPYGVCPQCSENNLELLQGEELRIREMEVT